MRAAAHALASCLTHAEVYLEVTAGILDKVGPAASTELPAPPEPEPEEVAQTSSAVDDDLAARIMAL